MNKLNFAILMLILFEVHVIVYFYRRAKNETAHLFINRIESSDTKFIKTLTDLVAGFCAIAFPFGIFHLIF